MAPLFANWKSGRAEGSTVRAEDLAEALREGRPVHLDGAVVEGELDLDGLEYPHRLILTHVVFLGHVHLNDARFRHTVDLTGCEFRQGVNFFATRVDGQLKLPKVRILKGDRPPVRHNFDQIQVTGRLNATLLHTEVPLSFRQARLGEIGFDGLRVEGDLDLQIARVAGDFFFKATEGGRSEVGGTAHMAGLQVDGHVELCGLRIGGSLNLANARIREDFRCSTSGGFRTEILGLASLAGARIGGVAYLDGRLFDPPEGAPAVPPRQRRRERRRDFFRRLIARGEVPEDGEARLKLDRTHLSKLALQERLPDRISADGMVFDDLELPACQGECEYTELLRRTRPFKRSTYLAVEAWLRNKGLDQAAKRVYVEMGARDLVTGHSSRPSRWIKWLFLGVGIGYGARPQRLIWLFLAAFALSCWVFSHPGALVSYSERLASQPEPLPAGTENVWMMLGVALRCHFPMLLFLGDPNYVPSPGPIPGLGLTYSGYALLISAVSWVMVPLFLAGLTGIVRQRQ